MTRPSYHEIAKAVYDRVDRNEPYVPASTLVDILYELIGDATAESDATIAAIKRRRIRRAARRLLNSD